MAFDLAAGIIAAASKSGIPSDILAALVQKESRGNPIAYGGAGEIGLAQIKQGTASQYGFDGANLWDPQTNLNVSGGILSALYKQFGNWRDALAGYNAGAGNIKAGQGYAADILSKISPDTPSGEFDPPVTTPNTPQVATDPNATFYSDPIGYLKNKGAALGASLGLGIVAVLLIAIGLYATINASKLKAA